MIQCIEAKASLVFDPFKSENTVADSPKTKRRVLRV